MKVYELVVNGKVVANSMNLNWIVNIALPWHQKRSITPVILVTRTI